MRSSMQGILEDIRTGKQYPLSRVTIIGRSEECNVRIINPRVSRRHAMIRKQSDGYWYYDLGSFNGSYLNGTRVTTTRRLTQGDVLDLAEHEYRFLQKGVASRENPTNLGGMTIALVRTTPVIILVSDVEGFTPMSEKLGPDDLAMVIGCWYADCERILSHHGATVDKFAGDSVLAFWTDISPAKRLAAMRAIRDLRAACEAIYDSKRELFDSLDLNFKANAALNIGKVAYGGMSQKETTLVGDPVNLTFRLEALTRSLGLSSLVSGEFVSDWPEGKAFCRHLGLQQVKGRSQAVDVFALEQFPA